MTFLRSSIAAGVAIVLAAGAVGAQQQTPAQPNGRPRGGEMREMRGTGRDMRPMRALFRDVKLTDAQRQQVRAINERHQAESRQLRDAMRPAMEEARAARQRGDTAAARQAWARTAEQRSRLAALAERQLTEVRAILTPDQQRQFDANRTAMRERLQERRDDRRDERRDGRGPRADRGAEQRGWRGRAR